MKIYEYVKLWIIDEVFGGKEILQSFQFTIIF